MSAHEMIGLACTRINPSVKNLEPVSLPTIDLDQSLPIIDIDHLNQHFVARNLTIERIGRACQKMGCFQVINHGINKSIIKGALEAASDFFELSLEEKAELASKDLSKPVRYDSGSSKDGISKDRVFLKHYAHPLSEWIGLWPQAPQDYREKMGKYAMGVRRVALQVMDAILESLGLGQAYLRDKLDDGMQVMAVNCYPQRLHPDLMVGLAPHTDYGCITILLQSCQGLQVTESDGENWKVVPMQPDTLHVHIGDHLEVLSNSRYKSVVHRAVLNSENQRISVASIHGLSMDEKVATAKELVDEQHPKGYKESSFRDFLDYLATNEITNGRSFLETLRIVGA